MLGIGGGGDAVGSLAVARELEGRGLEWVLGGVAWERFPVDPHPGPRPLADLVGARPLGTGAAVVDPERGATTPEGAAFCESSLAGFLDRETILIDITGGATGAAAGIRAAAAEFGCDLVMLVDIGGDAIAAGDEPGLASPLCDAVMIAGGAQAAADLDCLLCVLGAGCDGELRPTEVLDRVAALARVEAWIATSGVTQEAAREIEAAAAVAVTEASLLVARCALGETGEVKIRRGRRTVEAGPVAALTFIFDLNVALSELPLARAVADSDSIEAADDALTAAGVGTELGYERRRADESGGSPD